MPKSPTRSAPYDQQGASMVEAAIALMVVCMLLFGVVEGAMFARTYIVAEDASTAGVRAGQIAGNSSSADFDILSAIDRSGTALAKAQIVKVVVFKASAPDTAVPAACLNAPQTGGANPCNVYSSSDFSRPVSDFGSPSWSGDMNWAANTRIVSANAGPDYIGVYVQDKCSCMGSPLFSQLTARTAVVRIAPSVP